MREIEQTLSSVEVAEMVGKQHKDLMRDIKRYTKQMWNAIEECGGERNFAPTDFFRESTYRTEQNKELPCYSITKKGCEFIAHKLTGTKGTVFTARYINRFHEMETELSTGANQELLLYLKDKLERQEAVLADIKSQTKVRGYLQARTQNTVQSEYKQEIGMRVEASMDIEYLRAVYTFAKHYPNKSVVA